MFLIKISRNPGLVKIKLVLSLVKTGAAGQGLVGVGGTGGEVMSWSLGVGGGSCKPIFLSLVKMYDNLPGYVP